MPRRKRAASSLAPNPPKELETIKTAHQPYMFTNTVVPISDRDPHFSRGVDTIVYITATDGKAIDPNTVEQLTDAVKIYAEIAFHDDRSKMWRQKLGDMLCQSLGRGGGLSCQLADFPGGYKLWGETVVKVGSVAVMLEGS
jgi:hypothetical protein